MDVQFLSNGDMANLVCLLAGLFLVELGLTAAHGPRSAPVNSTAEFPSTRNSFVRE